MEIHAKLLQNPYNFMCVPIEKYICQIAQNTEKYRMANNIAALANVVFIASAIVALYFECFGRLMKSFVNG